MTPQGSTGISLCKLLKGRRLRTILDAVQPIVGWKVHKSQEKMTNYYNHKSKERCFSPGDAFYIRNHTDTSLIIWWSMSAQEHTFTFSNLFVFHGGNCSFFTGTINLYLYNTNSVCVCVCLSVTYRRPNCWTDHDQIWHVYADRSGNGSYLKKIGPTYGPEGWAHWGHSSKRVLSWRAAAFRAVAASR